VTTKPDKISNPFVYADQVIAGIDYSLRCPALCIIPPYREPSTIVPFAFCEFYFLTDTKSVAIDKGNIHGTLMGSWKTPEERYETIADWTIGVLRKHKCMSIGLEDYAFRASNQSALTQLAESTGLLKYFLHENAMSYTRYSISSIKKFSTSKGNATKDLMYDAWLKDNSVDLNEAFGRKPDASPRSPVSDMVDAYYIANLHRIEMCATNLIYEGKDIEQL
jgi:hypothetical protein